MMSQVSEFTDSILSIAKLLVQSRRSGVRATAECGRRRLVILGNGPSLRNVLDDNMPALMQSDCMAVNYAANTPEFFQVRPRYYTIADPHFFRATDDANVGSMLSALSSVDWPMVLFVPCRAEKMARLIDNSNIKTVRYNAVGIEGWRWLSRLAFSLRLGMPRPRNVLIPSVMLGIWLEYREIYLVGADHSWTRNLSVDDENRVVTNLPHYYADNSHERERVKAVYADVRLHSLFLSYYVAFKAYHEIAWWARERGVCVYNSTPGSFIDAFERRSLDI